MLIFLIQDKANYRGLKTAVEKITCRCLIKADLWCKRCVIHRINRTFLNKNFFLLMIDIESWSFHFNDEQRCEALSSAKKKTLVVADNNRRTYGRGNHTFVRWTFLERLHGAAFDEAMATDERKYGRDSYVVYGKIV